MTEEELKRNIDNGREWLKAHGFEPTKPVDGYFKWAMWRNGSRTVTFYELDDDEARDVIENGDCEDIWRCDVDYNEYGDYIQDFGFTPEKALGKVLAEYDAKMAEQRRQLFGLALDEIGADTNADADADVDADTNADADAARKIAALMREFADRIEAVFKEAKGR